LHGGRHIPAARQISWGNFFPELPDPNDADGGNISRRIDPLISRPVLGQYVSELLERAL